MTEERRTKNGILWSQNVTGAISGYVENNAKQGKTKHHGFVIGHVTSPVVHRGEAIRQIAEFPETVESEEK